MTNRIVSIIDDEIDITELFQDALCRNINRISVVSFNDPALALEHYIQNKQNYALIISDMRMPGMDGIKLIKKVKAINPVIRTLLITAFEVEDSVFHPYKKGNLIDCILQKPVSMKNLVTEVENQVKIQQVQKQK